MALFRAARLLVAPARAPVVAVRSYAAAPSVSEDEQRCTALSLSFVSTVEDRTAYQLSYSLGHSRSRHLHAVQELVKQILAQTQTTETLKRVEAETRALPIFGEIQQAIASPADTPLGPNLTAALKAKGLDNVDVFAFLPKLATRAAESHNASVTEILAAAEERRNAIEEVFAAHYQANEAVFKEHARTKERSNRAQRPAQESPFLAHILQPVKL